MFHFHSDCFQKTQVERRRRYISNTCSTCCNYLSSALTFVMWQDESYYCWTQTRPVMWTSQYAPWKLFAFHFLFLPLLLRQSRLTETVFQRSSVSLHKAKKSQRFKCHVQTFPHVSRVSCREGWHIIKASGLALLLDTWCLLSPGQDAQLWSLVLHMNALFVD